MKVTLTKPIEAHGEEITELTFRMPRPGDLRGIKVSINEDGLNLDLGVMLDLGAKLAGVPPSSFDKLEIADVVAILGQVVPLLDGLPLGGSTSPET